MSLDSSQDDRVRSPGHSVLAIGVPALEAWVRARITEQDASFLGINTDFANAHITVLGPWLDQPSQADLDQVAAIAAAVPPFDYRLEQISVFPNGVIHLRPDPDHRFVELTTALASAFPDHPPYGGQFGTVVPHLTLDALATGADVDSTRASLADLVGSRCRAEAIDLQWWAHHDCHARHRWALGTGHPSHPEATR